jgi:hypothetical protein
MTSNGYTKHVKYVEEDGEHVGYIEMSDGRHYPEGGIVHADEAVVYERLRLYVEKMEANRRPTHRHYDTRSLADLPDVEAPEDPPF